MDRKEYYKKNKEKIDNYSKKWRSENKEKHIKYQRNYQKEYYEKNKEKYKKQRDEIIEKIENYDDKNIVQKCNNEIIELKYFDNEIDYKSFILSIIIKYGADKIITRGYYTPENKNRDDLLTWIEYGIKIEPYKFHILYLKN